MARALRPIPTFEGDGLTVQFRLIQNIPGYSHVVVINGQKAGYLGSHAKPSVKAAAFFVEEWGKKSHRR